MSGYSELIKNFEKIRAYMREFYVYGFKSRTEYDRKSPRSYDNERRRLESWLGDYMGFSRTPEGKTVFLSIDSRSSRCNPLYKAWKSKSFTDGDITLHFILFDILYEESVCFTLAELMEKIDGEYLSHFENPMFFDESTLRKKLKEYVSEGILLAEKRGRQTCYRRASSPALPADGEGLHFFSEVAPCGVIGSFLLDKGDEMPIACTFKHHYITHTVDSDILAKLFDAMGKKSSVILSNRARRASRDFDAEAVPLKIFISAQSGRQHLVAYQIRQRQLVSYRLDYLTDVKPGSPFAEFDDYRHWLTQVQRHLWGVSVKKFGEQMDTVEFTVFVGEDEEYIVQRLMREKRCGTVERVDHHHYLFSATVSDGGELIPWIRTFLCRITDFSCSDKVVEARFWSDVDRMNRMYGLKGGEDE